MKNKYIDSNPTYKNISKCFISLMGYLNLILQFDTYKEDFEIYNNMLEIISKWAAQYEKTRKLDMIDNEILINLYEKSDILQTKYICNDKLGSESEFSDYVVNWLWNLRIIYKKYIEGIKNYK